jgi:hypothetical protein
MDANFIYFTSWIMQTCLSGYAYVSRTIWLNFTQEIKKCFKLQEDERKLKILSLCDESLFDTIKIDRWNTWFEARTRMLWYFENALSCKTRGYGLGNRRVQFLRIRPESKITFSSYLVRILRFMKRAMSNCLYICGSRPIVTCLRQN